jgi:hypothetical protein
MPNATQIGSRIGTGATGTSRVRSHTIGAPTTCRFRKICLRHRKFALRDYSPIERVIQYSYTQTANVTPKLSPRLELCPLTVTKSGRSQDSRRKRKRQTRPTDIGQSRQILLSFTEFISRPLAAPSQHRPAQFQRSKLDRIGSLRGAN